MKKILLILMTVLALSACSNSDYQSHRHPQGENVQSETGSDVKESPSEDTLSREEDEDTEKEPEDTNSEDDDEALNYTVEGTTNLRIAPSTDSYILGEVPEGADLLKIGENGDWTRVSYEGQVGYILTELLVPQE